ncbi:MAG TPA: phosphatidylinositol mannoside acyltransferase [Actinomycetota bacterium]
MSRETPKERLAYWSYRGLEASAMHLPEGMGRRLFAAVGGLAYRRLHGVRATVAANQARVLGLDPSDDRVRASTHEAFDLYARYWYDTFRVRRLPVGVVNERAEMVHVHHIDRALAAGRGCIVALPHMGNWDIGGHYLAVNGYAIAAVAEELRPARLSALFLRHREELGMRIIPLSKNGHVGQQLKQLLEKNWVVALVADRDITGRGVEVEMFGATRRVPAGPALLSLTSGAPLLVCPVYTTTRGWRIEIGAPLEIEPSGNTRNDVRALSRRMAAEFERAIAARPSDWHLFQPGWDPV